MTNVPASALQEYWSSIQPGYRSPLPEVSCPQGEGSLEILRAAAERFAFAHVQVGPMNPRYEAICDAFEMWMLTFGPPKEILDLIGVNVSGGWYWDIWRWNKGPDEKDAEWYLQKRYRELREKYKFVFRKDSSQPHVSYGHWDSYVKDRKSGQVVAYLPWHYDQDMRMFRLEIESPV